MRNENSPNLFYLVLSDSHGHRSDILEILSRQTECPDGLIFLGDGLGDINRLFEAGELRACGKEIDFFCVSGNCDFTFFGDPDKPPASRVLLLGDIRTLILHGHTAGVKSGLDTLLKQAYDADCRLAFFGHTHSRFDAEYTVGEKTIRIFNPGSVAEGSFGTLTIRKSDREMLLSHGEI